MGEDNNNNNNSQVSELLTIEASIKERIVMLEKVKEEMRPQKEMIDSLLNTNPQYVAYLEEVKKANKQKNSLKQMLLKEPQAKACMEKIKELKEQSKELNESLSYYLREFQRLTGANEFEGDDGELRKIVFVAKLVKKSGFEA